MVKNKAKHMGKKALRKAPRKTVKQTAGKALKKAVKRAEMIYTWGSKYHYAKRAARAVAGIEPFMKRTGSSVWRTKKDIDWHLESDKWRRRHGKAFGVLARWGKETKPNDTWPYHDLLVDAPIIELDDRGMPCEKSKSNRAYFQSMRKNIGAGVRKAL